MEKYTIKDVKNGVAKLYGYGTWEQMDFRAIDEINCVTKPPFAEERAWEEVVQHYAIQKVQEQRDIMAEELAKHFNMRNIPRPKL